MLCHPEQPRPEFNRQRLHAGTVEPDLFGPGLFLRRRGRIGTRGRGQAEAAAQDLISLKTRRGDCPAGQGA